MRKFISKNVFVSLVLTSVIGLVIFILSLFGTFEKLDYRLYDGMIHLKKDPALSEKIAIVAIDDPDINKLGEWPWSRDILADTLIYLKELQADSAIFDIEYISPTKLALAKNALPQINDEIDEIYGTSLDIIDGVLNYAQYGTSEAEINKIKQDLIDDALTPKFIDFSDFISDKVSFDNDEYFGKAIQFFENTFLTVNNVDLNYEYSDEDLQYITDRLLQLDVKDPKNYIVRDNNYTFTNSYKDDQKGFTPAMPSLLRRAKGFGFTNSDIDSDGVRRRIELIYEHDGKYYAQLVFEPILKLLDTNQLERRKNSLIIKNALLPGTDKRKDIKIPLDSHGRMLINWQKEVYADTVVYETYTTRSGFPTNNVQDIYRLGILEDNIYYYILSSGEYCCFDEYGDPLPYYYEIVNLRTMYEELNNLKKEILDNCTGYDNENNLLCEIDLKAAQNEYFQMKKDFFETLSAFVNGDSSAQIYQALQLEENPDEDLMDFYQNYNNLFEHLRLNYDEYTRTTGFLSEHLANKLCIVGMTAASTTDLGATPLDKQYANVYIHANVGNTILTENFFYCCPWYISFIIVFVLLLCLSFFANKSSVFLNIFGAIVRVCLILAFVLIFVFGNIYLPVVGSVIFLGIADYLAGVAYRYLLSSRDRKHAEEMASSFANKDTVQYIKKHPELLDTVGERKSIIAMFTDVQKFSTLSECLEKIYGDEAPNILCNDILNPYLGEMSDIVLNYDGTIDKYEGDAIIAMFGAPDYQSKFTFEEWAYRSIASAIRMKESEVRFNENHPDLFQPVEVVNKEGQKEIVQMKPLQTRIGLNAGQAYTGFMGSKTESFSKLNYTMMGDTVNLASRLEGVNKVYKSWILMSEDTWNLANTGDNKGKITVRKLDRVRVIGKNIPIQLYNAIGFTEELSETKLKAVELFNKAIDMYLAKDFKNAEKEFLAIYEMDKKDETPLVFAERCKEYIVKGVNENWDGVMQMTSK